MELFMNRALALSNLRNSFRLWLSGMLLLLGAIWLGLLAIEYGLGVLAPGANGGGANSWTEQTLFGAIASLVSIVLGVLILHFSRNRHPHAHVRHRRNHARRPVVARPSETEEPTSPISGSDGDESVSFDMDAATAERQLPPDTPGAPPQRTKVKVRVKQRIRQRIRENDKK
jgi:hypothetical protein